jgi:hypothetical protein
MASQYFIVESESGQQFLREHGNGVHLVELTPRIVRSFLNTIKTKRTPAKSAAERAELRKQMKDRETAEQTIALLMRWECRPEESESFREAVRLERMRLQSALCSNDPYRLKRIFRRKET